MGNAFSFKQDLLDRCLERAPGYDRDNRFFQEDFEELRDAGYLLTAVPKEFGGPRNVDGRDRPSDEETGLLRPADGAGTQHAQLLGRTWPPI